MLGDDFVVGAEEAGVPWTNGLFSYSQAYQ
jgi:hypothetical protein